MPKGGKIVRLVARARMWVRRHIPPGLRWLAGLLLILMGFMGFLPILGFWMIPLGIAVAAMDIKPLWKRFDTKYGIGNNDAP